VQVSRSLSALLAVVALAAAVLSFDALHGLAVLCGFSPWLAPLLPVTVDAGAAAGSLVWLRGKAPGPARRFARVLALVLLAGSVAGNALGHGLTAYGAAPAWWVVVVVSAVPPAVLGAVVHLAVLAGRSTGPAVEPIVVRQLDEVPLAALEHLDDPDPAEWWDEAPEAGVDRVDEAPTLAELVAAGAGRRKIARTLGIPESRARTLLEQHRAAERAEEAA
jgi:hypothetical protein